MYCEKCGKSNPEGAIFCSNCSSILRSRRAAFNEPEKEAKEPAAVAAKTEAPKVHNPEPEILNTRKFTPKKNEPMEAEKPINPYYPPMKDKKPAAYEPHGAETEEDKIPGGAWCSLLMITSWLIFFSIALVGVLGGGWMMLYGMTEKISIMIFGGVAVIIVALVAGLAILSRSMVSVSVWKALKKIK